VTDASITSAVKARLLADPDVSGLRIDVDTKNQVVTLKGTLKTQAEKAKAIQIARNVDTIKDVTDRLTIKQQQ
jgi:hyperosmotically inducible protein